MGKDVTLAYMVAGISSRFGGAIKQFTEVGPHGETLIEFSMNQAISAGFNKIVFIVGEKTKKPFMEKFGSNYKGVPVAYAYQGFDISERDKPWGTVDALCSLRGLVREPFVICNGDDLYGSSAFELLATHLSDDDSCAAVGYPLAGTLPETGYNNRALFQVAGDFVFDLREHFGLNKQNLTEKGHSDESLCSMNIYAFLPEAIEHFYEYLLEFKEKNKGSRTVECLLPDVTGGLLRDGKIRMKIFPAREMTVGVTAPGDEIRVREFLRSREIESKQSFH